MDAPPDFLERVTREPQPLLAGITGTLRFDVVDGDATTHNYIAIDHGAVTVTHDDAPADVVARMHRQLFDDIRAGRANAVAATLRGEITIDGNPRLLNIFQRLFPGPGEVKPDE
jgi:putative sterol carrier protein